MIYLITNPIYVFESGLPQPADVFMSLMMLILLTGYFVRVPIHSNLYLVASLFLGLIAIVNWMWWIEYTGDNKFLLSSMFYLYNFAIIVVITTLFREFGSSFLIVTRFGLLAALLLEFMIIVIFPEFRGIRAIGTFNNPNQLGYWALLVGACILSLKTSSASSVTDARLGILDVAILCALGYIAAHSLSKAAMVSFLTLFAIGVWFQGVEPRMKLALGAVAMIGAASLLTNADGVQEWLSQGWIARVGDRLQNIGVQGDDTFAGRGYDRIWEYPEYLLYGAGEGGPERFDSVAREIHSTFATILFSYGVLGFCLFLALLWMIFREAERRHIWYFFPICLYGLTHQGLRFSLLWVFLGLVFALTAYGDPHDQRWRMRLGHHGRVDIGSGNQAVPRRRAASMSSAGPSVSTTC